MRPFVLALVLAVGGAPSHAQEADPLREAAEAYVASEGVQRSIDASVSAELIVSALDAQLGTRLSPEERDAIAGVVSEEMTSIRPAMEAAMVDAAARTFTLEEMEAMTAFYSSGPGAGLLAKMPGFTAAYLEAMGPDLRDATERAMARAAELATPD